MDKAEVSRLAEIEKRALEIAKDWGLLTTDIIFEIVPSQRVMEASSYYFPENFSHWTFGRDYDRHRTIYYHSGAGLPYEIVWNFNPPRAFLMNSNPFGLQSLTIAHVLGHVDFFLANRFLRQARSLADMAEEARVAADRFRKYEELYGKREVERLIDAAMSIQWHQHPDPFFEEADEDEIRERLLTVERAKLEKTQESASQFQRPKTKKEIEKTEERLRELEKKSPPVPVYDLLAYIARHSPRGFKSWQIDVLKVVRSQARYLAHQRRTKGLNEGWATYWHQRITQRLVQEGLLSSEEHGEYLKYHSAIIAPLRRGFNWYRIFFALFQDIKERWDKGRFGKEYEECRDAYRLLTWDNKAGLGTKKIFEVRADYSDRMAVEDLFTDEFIHDQQIYIYGEAEDKEAGEIQQIIVEDDPAAIREILLQELTNYHIPVINITNANVGNNQQQLYLKHEWTGFELDPNYRDLTLERIYELWGRKVYLETIFQERRVVYWFDGQKHGSTNR